MGCHITDRHESTFMIPSGFATEDELKYSDGASMISAVNIGVKNADEMADYCYDRIRGKGGTSRKHYNSSRPTNSMRFVISPAKGNLGTLPPSMAPSTRTSSCSSTRSRGMTRGN